MINRTFGLVVVGKLAGLTGGCGKYGDDGNNGEDVKHGAFSWLNA